MVVKLCLGIRDELARNWFPFPLPKPTPKLSEHKVELPFEYGRARQSPDYLQMRDVEQLKGS